MEACWRMGVPPAPIDTGGKKARDAFEKGQAEIGNGADAERVAPPVACPRARLHAGCNRTRGSERDSQAQLRYCDAANHVSLSLVAAAALGTTDGSQFVGSSTKWAGGPPGGIRTPDLLIRSWCQLRTTGQSQRAACPLSSANTGPFHRLGGTEWGTARPASELQIGSRRSRTSRSALWYRSRASPQPVC